MWLENRMVGLEISSVGSLQVLRWLEDISIAVVG